MARTKTLQNCNVIENASSELALNCNFCLYNAGVAGAAPIEVLLQTLKWGNLPRAEWDTSTPQVCFHTVRLSHTVNLCHTLLSPASSTTRARPGQTSDYLTSLGT